MRRLARDPQVARSLGDGTPWTEGHLQRRIAGALDRMSPTTRRIATGPGGVAFGLLAAVAP